MADYIDNEKLEEEGSSGFDFRKIWSQVVLNWYWFIISTLVCVALAYVYLRYQPAVYQASMKILVKDDDNKSRRYSSNSMAMDQLGMLTNSNGFDNEMEILTSVTIATRAVSALKLYVTYSIEGRVTDVDIYKSSPILVDLEESRQDQLKSPVKIEINKKGKGIKADIYLPTTSGKTMVESHTITKFPAEINTNVGKIMFSQNPGHSMTSRMITATIYPPIAMGRAYAKRVKAQATSKMTSVALVSILDTNKDRAIDYLSELINSYNLDANQDKNEVAKKTEEFIKDRIEVIRGELDETEGQLEGFKRSNELINLPTDASQALNQSTQFQKEQVAMQTQMSLVRSLQDYVNNPANCMEVIPANLGITDAAVNRMVAQYNEAVLERNRLIRNASEDAPKVLQITDQVQGLWVAIQQQLNSIYNNLSMQKSSIDKQYALFSGKVSSTPTQERVLNNIGRQQEIKSGLYLMLLQKREENYISLASTAAKARVIDEPQSGGKVSPKSSLIMLAAFIIGLLFPLLIFYLEEMLRFRIEGREDIEKLTKLPILADIPLSKEIGPGERAIVVKENTNNMMEEAFRGLRTNLRFVMGPGEKVLCTTSTVPSEGKTFVATNLAMSLALLGKKVLIVGLDVRKPRLVKLFGLPSSKQGITTYLSADNADFDLLDKQIFHGVVNPNLDVLPAGVIPPNPGELITRDLLDKGFEHLKSLYDYIIVDTPPIGLVSDTFELARLCDVTFFVVRSEYSTRGDFEQINRVSAEGKLPKMNLVLNGVDLAKKKYGFYYGYGKYGTYSRYGTYYGRYGHYGTYGNYGDKSQHVEK